MSHTNGPEQPRRISGIFGATIGAAIASTLRFLLIDLLNQDLSGTAVVSCKISIGLAGGALLLGLIGQFCQDRKSRHKAELTEPHDAVGKPSGSDVEDAVDRTHPIASVALTAAWALVSASWVAFIVSFFT